MLTKSILKRDSGLAFATTFFHFGVPTAAGLLALPFAARRAKSDGAELSLGFDRRELGAIAVLAICQALGFFFTNLSLQAVAVSFSHTVKACAVPLHRDARVARPRPDVLAPHVRVAAPRRRRRRALRRLGAPVLALRLRGGDGLERVLRDALGALVQRVFARGRVGPIALYILLCAGALGYLALSAALTGGLLSAFSGARPLLPPMFSFCGATHFSYNVLSFMILEAHVADHPRRSSAVRSSPIVIGALVGDRRQRDHPMELARRGIATTGVIGYAWTNAAAAQAKDA